MLFLILFLGVCIALIRLQMRRRQRERYRQIGQAVANRVIQEEVRNPMRNSFETEMDDVVGSILAQYGMDDPQTRQEVLASAMESYDLGVEKALNESQKSENRK